MVCPKCRLPVIENARFCGSCGQALDAANPSRAAESRITPPPQAFEAAPAGAGMAMAGAGMAGAGAGAGAAAASVPPHAAFNTGAGQSSLLQRVKGILLSPANEWQIIEPELTSVGQLYAGYVVPLAGLAALMSFVRTSVIGVSIPFGSAYRAPLGTGLMYALMTFGMGLVGLFLVGLIINLLAPTFAGVKDQRQALKVAAYAFTPAWLSTLFNLLPSFGTLLQFVAGLYGIYLLYLGLPVLMRSARERAFGYTATVVICTIVLGILLGVLSAAFGGASRMSGGMGAFGRPTPAGFQSPEAAKEAAREQGAATVANILGNALGTDEKGKAGLGAAIANLAKVGEQAQQEQAALAAPNSAQAAANAAAASAGTSAAGQGTAGTANPQNVATAATGLLSALGGALGGSRHVDPVDFHTLEGVLPTALPGMTRSGAQGNAQQALGVKSTSATGNYQGGTGSHVEIRISDISGVAGLMDAAGSLVGSDNSESDTGYEKDAVVGGRSVHEKYDNTRRHGEVEAIVAKRFEVDVTGDAVDMPALERYLGSVDLAKLEAMQNAGAQQ